MFTHSLVGKPGAPANERTPINAGVWRYHPTRRQFEVFAHIGVPEEERSAPQRLTFSITLWPKRNASELDDQIAKAVNYAAVCTETKNFVRDRSDRLIETLADALASRLLEVFEIRRITIELRKFILPETKFVSVTVTRDRAAE